MLLPGAEELEMSHSQCLELLEGVEDTIDFFVSGLTYLIHRELRLVVDRYMAA